MRTYTTAVTIPDETAARISRLGLRILYNPDGTPSTASRFGYIVEAIDANGSVIDTRTQSVTWSNLPASAKDHLRALYNLCLANAESTGLIQPGDDSDDL